MSSPKWMPLYVGDFIADTMHLSAIETGIYIRLLMHCWQHHVIPRDDRQLCLISHCEPRIWHLHKEKVLAMFCTVDASTMQHRRVTRELRRSLEISNKRKGSAKQMLSKRQASAEQLLTHLHLHKKESSLANSSIEEPRATVADRPQAKEAAADCPSGPKRPDQMTVAEIAATLEARQRRAEEAAQQKRQALMRNGT